MSSFTELDHPQRHYLNDEVHARPSDSMSTPSRVTYIVNKFGANASGDEEWQRLALLISRLGGTEPAKNIKHVTAQFAAFRLRWERHTEFSRYAFIYPDDGNLPFTRSPLEDIPEDWLESLRDDLMVAVHLHLLELPEEGLDVQALSSLYFDGATLIGAMIADSHAAALTDFRIQDDGFTRYLVLNESMPDARAGRYVQRLFELETYRMMALLSLPVAQDLFPELNKSEQELAAINEALVDAEAEDDGELLERLTILAAVNQGRHAATNFRFAASEAYYDLVVQRNEELREQRIPGIQTFTEFTTRRLTPAIKTCRAVARRQQLLVSRMARSTQLLSTRIDVERQRQNQSLLKSVNQRLKSQLQLQATVEGISVAAVTYYVVGLVGIVASGFEDRGLPVNASIVTAIAVPIIAGTTFYFVRKIRMNVSDEEVE